MLGKHILGYIPSLVVPGVTAFGAVYCFTRLMSPEEYGGYSLVINTMMLLTMLFFYWLQLSLPRLLPKAAGDGCERHLVATTYVAFFGMCILLIAFAAAAGLCLSGGGPLKILWLAVPLTIARSLLTLNQAIHRSALNLARYNLLECGQAALGLAFGLGLVSFLRLGDAGAVWGMVGGIVAMILVDMRRLASIRWRDFRADIFKETYTFGLPLVAAYGLSYILSSSDRYVIEYFDGSRAVGLYSAGYSLMDRIGSIVFMMISTPSYPLIVHKYEHEGEGAARAQMRANGIAVLALALPACAGLLLTSGHLAQILIGEEFRQGAMEVMPWIALSTMLNGLATHYFSHAFYITKKSHLLIFTQGPAALLNVVLNIVLIPRIGYIAAAYSTLVSYVVVLIATVWIGRRVFPFSFPYKEAAQIAASSAVMAAFLSAVWFPDTVAGLAEMVGAGAVVYGVCLFAFDLMSMRALTKAAFLKILARREAK